jgi:HD-GYP domain-containing protein (c-di-GMP phosphodiesterase class II)
VTPAAPDPPAPARLAELLAALSLVTDLARGRPPEEAMRACLLATRMARIQGLREPEAAVVYATTLLRFVGCTATSLEYAQAFGGDDVRVRGRGDQVDPTVPAEALGLLWGLGDGSSPLGRLRLLAHALPRAKRVTAEGVRADCEVAASMARRFGLEESVEAALWAVFERWDGHGGPRGLRGEQIPLAARFAAVAYAAVIFADLGSDAAVETVRRWSGRILDPDVADAFAGHGRELLEELERLDDLHVAVVAAEPGLRRTVTEGQLDQVARGFADVVDLKSPYLHGHSAAVAELAEAAARLLGMPEPEVVALRRAGLFHDLGRAGVPTGLWDKPGPLSRSDWEQVRLHPYHSERILGRAPMLAAVGRLAGAHHERLDGSGYHRGTPAQLLGMDARVLAAADAYQALTSERPHRPANPPAVAARALQAEPGLDRQAVAAVLEAAGHRPARRISFPAGLTGREVEVLRLLVRGRSEAQIAAELFIAASTVHTHVTHIYDKAGVSTRAGAAVFAMEHGLILPTPTP